MTAKEKKGKRVKKGLREAIIGINKGILEVNKNLTKQMRKTREAIDL